MSRKRSHTRRTPRSNPRGRLDVRRGGYVFVQTAEGEFFIPRKKMRGAFPGDVVEIAPPLDDSLASMYAGRKIVSEAWGIWADELGTLIRF